MERRERAWGYDQIAGPTSYIWPLGQIFEHVYPLNYISHVY